MSQQKERTMQRFLHRHGHVALRAVFAAVIAWGLSLQLVSAAEIPETETLALLDEAFEAEQKDKAEQVSTGADLADTPDADVPVAAFVPPSDPTEMAEAIVVAARHEPARATLRQTALRTAARELRATRTASSSST